MRSEPRSSGLLKQYQRRAGNVATEELAQSKTVARCTDVAHHSEPEDDESTEEEEEAQQPPTPTAWNKAYANVVQMLEDLESSLGND